MTGSFDSGRLVSQRTSIMQGLLADIPAFLIPCTIFLEVSMGGRLFAPEILMVVILPFLIFSNGRRLLEPLPRTLILLLFFWFFGQFLTDLIRETPLKDYSRGWAKISFVTIDFVVAYLLLGENIRRWLFFAIGLAIGNIIGFFYAPSEYAITYPWKFGVGSSATALLVMATHHHFFRNRFTSQLILFLVAVLNIYLGFRSLGLICALTGLFLFAHKQTHKHGHASMGSSVMRYMMVIMVSVMTLFGVVALYEYSASTGLLGEIEQQKYVSQSIGDFGILLGGRSEFLASSQAILDSPLIGHGSWAKDQRYVELLQNRLKKLGYKVIGFKNSDQIPSHSYLFGSWVEAGILGALLWIWILRLVYRFFYTVHLSQVRPAPWVIFSALLLGWNVLFSPLGADQRLLAAYQIALIMLVLRATREETKGQLIRRAS